MAVPSVKYVSQKISKIRWRPRPKQSLQPSDTFATGSWDDEENKLSLWQVQGQDPGSSRLAEEDALAQNEPQLLCEVQHPGNVMDLCFVTQEHIATASSTGSLILYQHHANLQHVQAVQEWMNLHSSSGRACPCTAVATCGEDTVVTGGEDGRISLLSPGQTAPVRVLERADSCTINSMTFLKQAEVLTVNAFGQLKIFDLRQNTDTPAQIFSVTEDHWSLLCVDKHPGQPHVVATGGQDGSLTIWDLRQDRFPMTALEAHASSMWEVRFHPHHAEHLFTCSEDGSLWHWDGSALTSTLDISAKGGGEVNSKHTGHHSPWLGLDASRNKLEITSILPYKSLPVNTLDIEGAMLVCGTDSETIYTVTLPQLT
ncbi:hypothetical protein BaRGS_00013932 [Batillaria attramentaria]|uniref:Nucleoporin Nup43 n=1 Tax=Batillaria attramentaria TaxID=370345 RepID=A0ABD0L5Z1_9CAEN